MNVQLEELDNEWRNLRQELKDNRLEFDNFWREKNKDHSCDTKVYAENGEWFCNHLTIARNRKFKQRVDRIDEIIVSMVSLTK